MDNLQCPALGAHGNNAADQPDEVTLPSLIDKHNLSVHNPNEATEDKSSLVDKEALVHNSSTSKLVYGIFFPLALVTILLIWVLYAYRNPYTKSGQFLIQVSNTVDL